LFCDIYTDLVLAIEKSSAFSIADVVKGLVAEFRCCRI
jgi:hypothetical protein